MSETYHLRLLGPVEVKKDDETVRGFVSRKAPALLGYLAVQPRPVSRIELVDLLWPDKSEARGRGNLSRVLNNLHTLLPNCIEADYHAVRLSHKDTCWLDVAAFDGLTARQDVSALTNAADLYRGEFMADIYLDDCPAFEAWLVAERERWHRRVVQVLRGLIKHHTYHRQYDQGLSFASRLLALAPWLEEAHRDTMLLLARGGQRGAALAQYQTCRRRLAEELGVEPSAETNALYERIRAAESPPRHNLPAQPSPFVGREAELAEASRLLEDPDCRLLTITGPGGMGKTRLALQAATPLASGEVVSFLNGVFFVPLAGVGRVDLLAPTIADALGLSLYGATDPNIQLLNHLRDKEMLFILDNFEHLLAGTGLLLDILGKAPDIKLIVTSRARLNLRWEWLLDLRGLGVPRSGNPDDGPSSLERYSALSLFVGTARRVKRDFSVAREWPFVTRICQLVEGMPLGVELAAAGVRERSCQAIAQEIEHNLDSLSTSWRDLPARHRSMRAVFNYSWDFLSPQEQRVFRKLSVFRGGFQLDAAQQIADASGSLLSSLVGKSFLRQDASGRYDMHELLRQYSAEKLNSVAEEYQETHHRHCTYFTRFMQERVFRTGSEQHKIRDVENEFGNARAGWNWAVEHGKTEEISRSADALWGYYEIRGRFQEGRAVFKDARMRLGKQFSTESSPLVGIESSPIRSILGLLLARQSWFQWRLSLFREAQERLFDALALLRQADSGYRLEMGLCLWQLGGVAWYLGEYVEAKAYLRESLTIGKEIDERMLVITCLQSLGLIDQAQGRYLDAQQLFQESYNLSRRIDQRQGMAKALIFLGYLACLLEEHSEAEQLLRDGLQVANELQDKFGIILGLWRLGSLMAAMRRYEEAKELYEDSLATSEEIGDRWGISLSVTQLGLVAYALGEYPEAAQYLHQALELAMEIGTVPVVLAALAGMAKLLVREGKQRRALELLSIVLHHPASEQETKDRAEGLLSELESQIPQARAIIKAQAHGRARKLEDVVQEILITGSHPGNSTA